MVQKDRGQKFPSGAAKSSRDGRCAVVVVDDEPKSVAHVVQRSLAPEVDLPPKPPVIANASHPREYHLGRLSGVTAV